MAKAFAKRFYNSRQWKAARQAALRRDMFTCQRCGGRAEEVHHIIELTPQNIADDLISLGINNLECLCHNCHTKETQGSDVAVIEGLVFDSDGYVVRL